MDRNDPGSSRMLIGRDRIFYWGFAGNAMKERRLGATVIYAAPAGDFEISVQGAPWRRERIARVEPFVPHRLRSSSGWISCLCIEPETVSRSDLDALAEEVRAPQAAARLLARIGAAQEEAIAMRSARGFTAAEFDTAFFGRRLGPRSFDARIGRIVAQLTDEGQDQLLSAQDCATRIGVSTSRFLHLFKESTDTAFRSQRMWKRARRFLDHAAEDSSLTDVALDLGYPDSSHFSHTIRATYGLQPRSIRKGSRRLRVCMGAGYAASAAF